MASRFDDLCEDVLRDVVSVLHGGLSVVDPLSSSCAQQAARFLHFLDERSVHRIVLESESLKMSHSYKLPILQTQQ